MLYSCALTKLTIFIAVIRRETRKVDEVLPNDYLFSLEVSLSPTSFFLVPGSNNLTNAVSDVF